jgi:hypothetical protein
MYALCSATTRAGDACRFAARKVTGLCVNHDPSYKEQQHRNATSGGKKIYAGFRAYKREQNPPVTLEDRASIQALAASLLTAELQGNLSPTQARNAIRLLNIAARNFDKPTGGRAFHGHEYYLRRRKNADQLLLPNDPPNE